MHQAPRSRFVEPGTVGAPSGAPTRGATAPPLWPVVAILGDIAARVERRRAEEGAPTPPNEGAAGGEPAAREEAA